MNKLVLLALSLGFILGFAIPSGKRSLFKGLVLSREGQLVGKIIIAAICVFDVFL
jgi:hypothetical protein